MKSWIRDYTHPRNPWAGSIGKPHLVKAVKATILDLLDDKNVSVVMACCEKRRDQIYGFCCFEQTEKYPVVHYVYVKAPFRGCKIGTDLVDIARGSYEGVIRYGFKTRTKFLNAGKFNWNVVRRNRQKENADAETNE